MTQANRLPACVRVAVAVGVCAVSVSVSAQPTSDRPASIIIFPKVVATSAYDTTIQITNITNMAVSAHCFYIDAEPVPGAPPLCSTTDFIVDLTAQQPTFWVASQGRPAGGLSTGAIPPVSSLSFVGALLCLQIDISGAPFSGNGLVGLATLKNLTNGDVAKYNAVGLQGFDTNNADQVLCLGGSVTEQCPTGAEYEGCPQYWRLDHYADNTTDDLAGAGSAVKTDLTVLPCTHNFEAQLAPSATPSFLIENEMEQVLSASTTVNCWSNTGLSTIAAAFGVGLVGTNHAQTKIGTVVGSGSSGLMVVAQEFHQAPGGIFAPIPASAAVDVHPQGLHDGGDVIILPVLQP